MILDLNDEHWRDVFTEAEIAELFDYGKPLTRPLPTELTDQFDAMSKLVIVLYYESVIMPLHFYFARKMQWMLTNLLSTLTMIL